MLARVLMPALRRGLRLPMERDALRQDLLRLLGATLLIVPTLQPELSTLLSPHEPEADFFHNITHVQMPRRQRALARLRTRIASGAFSTPTLSNYLLPLLRHLVLRDGAKEVDVAEEAVQTLQALAQRLPWRPYLSTLQAFTRLLKKQPYLEKRLIRAIVATLEVFHFDLSVDDEMLPHHQEGGMRFVLTEFRSEASTAVVAAAAPAAAPAAAETAVVEAEEGGEEDDDDEEEGKEEEEAEEEGVPIDPVAAAAKAAAVMRQVRCKLLPSMYSHLKDPKTEGVRVAVALAVLKLLLLMPPRILEAELRGFLVRVVATLGSRLNALRQQGRETLAKIVVELGSAHFGAVVREMSTSLTRGYQLHVLGYSLHHLLVKLVPAIEVGSLDYCMERIVKLLLSDLYGEAAEKKEVEEIASSMKEARATKSYASFELIAAAIQFTPNINLLVPPLHQATMDAPGGVDSLKNIGVAREVLRHIALGLHNNPSVDITPLCAYVQGLMTTHLPNRPDPGGSHSKGQGSDGSKRKQSKSAAVGSVLQPMTEPGVTSGSGRTPLGHELLAFAVGLLMTSLKRGKFSPSNPAHLQLLEPLLPLLQRSMRADSDAVVSLSLRTVGALMSYPLPSLPDHATALLERTLSILKRAANSRGTELVAIGVKVVTTLLRRPPAVRSQEKQQAAIAAKQKRSEGGGEEEEEDDDDEVEPGGGAVTTDEPSKRVGGGATLTEPQLRWLLTFVSTHLEDATLQSSLFGLLRVVFGRKFVLSELYDLILVLGDMVLQADSAAIRSSASHLYLTFLLKYPLGPKRLQQHLTFLVTNLPYPVPHGRLSLLSLIQSTIEQLPLPVLQRQADLLLLPWSHALSMTMITSAGRRLVGALSS